MCDIAVYKAYFVFLSMASFDVVSPLLFGLFLKEKLLQRFEKIWRNR